jgi:hypothetical protein
LTFHVFLRRTKTLSTGYSHRQKKPFAYFSVDSLWQIFQKQADYSNKGYAIQAEFLSVFHANAHATKITL